MSTISANTTITQSTIGSYTWPVTINGGTSSNPVVVKFGSNLTFSNANNYFIFGSEYVTLDGSWNNVTVNNVPSYPGLVDNTAWGNVIIQNIGVLSTGTTTLRTGGNEGGWIAQRRYGATVLSGPAIIQNCHSNGAIPGYCGGICGVAPGSGNGNVIVRNCYSTGNVFGDHAGGITGGYSGAGGSIIVTNCYSTGAVTGPSAGGILGGNSGAFGGKITATHCYASHNICGLIGADGPDPVEIIIDNNTIYNGSWNSTTVNAALLGLGTIWNTSVTPYTLLVPVPPVPPTPTPDLGGSNLGGGPYNGYSPIQTVNNYKDSEQVMTRRILRDGWNGGYASGTYNGYKSATTPFRAVNNSGDFLSRANYSCGGSNQVNADKPGWKGIIGSIPQNCDGTNVPASTCNVKFVADSSDYTTYRKQKAFNQNYNDLANGGDEHNASYVDWMGIRRY